MNKFSWQGRIDDLHDPLSKRIHQRVMLVEKVENIETGFAILGYACDIGVMRNQGRVGAKDGPQVVRSALGSLPYSIHIPIYDFGDISGIDEQMESTQDCFASLIGGCLSDGHRTIGIGGGHEISYGHFLGIKDYLKNHSKKAKLGIINVDSHLDLRPLVDGMGNSGTPFYQILADKEVDSSYLCYGFQRHANTQRLVNFAKEKEVVIIDRDDIMEDNKWCHVKLEKFISRVDHIYLTIDLDGLSAAICPGVSAPNAFGLQVEQVCQVIDRVCQSGKLLSVDIAECNPKYDIDNHTARTAAFFIYRIMEKWSGSKS